MAMSSDIEMITEDERNDVEQQAGKEAESKVNFEPDVVIKSWGNLVWKYFHFSGTEPHDCERNTEIPHIATQYTLLLLSNLHSSSCGGLGTLTFGSCTQLIGHFRPKNNCLKKCGK